METLRSFDVFRDCRGEDLSRLAEAASLHRVKRGQALEAQHDKLLAIVRGLAGIRFARDGGESELLVEIFGAGDLCSNWCWGDAGGGTLVALEETVVMLLPRRALETLWLGDGAAALRFLEAVAHSRARALALAVQNACLDVGARVYCRLVELAHRRGRKTAEGLHVPHGLSQSELAEFSSTTRENVNRHLNEWRARGWIELKRRVVLVRDPEALGLAVGPAARRVGFGAGDGRLPLRAR
ncbi:MAG: Crp/Fnr family transcriptional regulator [Candidatus Binatia bacterium]